MSFKIKPIVVKGILFDLDGTLADTAPDLSHAINIMRAKRNLEPKPFHLLRSVASAGVPGLLERGFNISTKDDNFENLRQEFLDIYSKNLCIKSAVFPKIFEILNYLKIKNIRWGIVTNKIFSLAQPLVEQLKLFPDKQCLVGGDTTPYRKPHPAPLIYGANVLELSPESIVYVGDDQRDITASIAANMASIAVGYGYGGQDVSITTWQADYTADSPNDLYQIISNLIESA